MLDRLIKSHIAEASPAKIIDLRPSVSKRNPRRRMLSLAAVTAVFLEGCGTQPLPSFEPTHDPAEGYKTKITITESINLISGAKNASIDCYTNTPVGIIPAEDEQGNYILDIAGKTSCPIQDGDDSLVRKAMGGFTEDYPTVSRLHIITPVQPVINNLLVPSSG